MASSLSQCVVCCHESTTWSVGVCDHPICLTCSARLRVLCEHTICPVCRIDLKQVSVTNEVKPYTVLVQDSRPLCDRKYGFLFRSAELRDRYDALRSYRCTKCVQSEGPFKSFDELRDHARRAHGVYYCDICVTDLKLFPAEHKTYTRSELTVHRREGDPDDTSHRGHPLCEFCDDRFLDKDALLHHLRTVHQWCHVCEGLGKGQNYYADYQSLRQHFRKEHFLCEEGHCRHAKNTSVFATKIDFQAHKAAEHSTGLSKSEVKQLRQIEVKFTYSRRSALEREEMVGQGGPPRSRVEEREREEAELSAAMQASRYDSYREDSGGARKSSFNAFRATDNNVPDTSAPSRASSKRQTTDECKSRKGKDTAVNSTGGLLVRRNEECSKLEKDTKDNATSSAEIANGEVVDNLDVKTASTAAKVRKPPGFEHVACTQEPSSSVPQGSMCALQKTNPPVGSSSWQKMTAVQDDWPSLKVPETKTKSNTAPPGFQQPNVKASSVISKVQESVRNRDAYDEFRILSGLYARGEIGAFDYHKRCSKLFDGYVWNSLGPELARTLPDESKQKELLAIFQRVESATSDKDNKSRPKHAPHMPQVSNSGVWASRVDRNFCDEEFPSLQAAVDIPSYPAPAPGWNSRVLGTAT